MTMNSDMATVLLKWADGATGVSLCIPAKTNIDVEPASKVIRYSSFRWLRNDATTSELYISPGGCVIIEARS